MIKNYIKIALRNVIRHKGYSFINITGLSVGMAAFLLIFLYVSFELSYDDFHENADHIYRIRNDRIYKDIHDKSAGCPPAVGPTIKKEFPEVLESARIYNVSYMNNIVSYVAENDYIQTVNFQLKGYDNAGKVALVGSLNNWSSNRNLLERKEEQWECEIQLTPGEYRYIFIVDDNRILDPNNPNQEQIDGRAYSVITIKQPASTSKIVSFNQDKVFYAEASFLKIFSFPMLEGSPELSLDNPDTAIISESSARKYFGNGDPLGKMIIVTNNYGKQFYKITGIFKDVAENSHIKFELLLSYKTLINLNNQAAYYWGWNAFNTYVLIEPKADPHALEMKFPQLIEKYNNYDKDYRRQYILQPIKDIHLHSNLRHEPEVNGNARTIYFLTIISVFILLIAWINYINLSTTRSIKRAKEVGIRKVLGSSHLQLIKQFIFESVFLNILAVIIALVIVEIFLPYFSRLTGKPLILLQWSNTWLWLALSISIGAIFSAIYPAFILSSFNPVTVLKVRLAHLYKGINFRRCLVIFQFAISIILIIGTLIVYKQLSFMRNQDLGIDIEQILAVKIPGELAYSANHINRFKKELLGYPSIKNITASSTIPGKEYSNASSGIRPLNSNPEDGKRCFFITVDYEYFDFFGIKLLAGRKFSKAFSTDMNDIILNEEAAKIFGYENPNNALKQKILHGGLGEQIKETIGVIKNYHHKSLKESLQPIIFSLTEGDVNGRNNYFSLKISGRNIDQTISLVKNKWEHVFPGKPFDYFFLDESFSNQYKSDQQFGRVFGLFTMLAFLISCLGLFGLASFTTEQRTKEIGIRKILGASVSSILLFLTKEFTKWVLIANIIAWPIAYYAMHRWLQDFAYRTNIGIFTFIISALLALTIALLTVSYQAVKAALANPIEALRYE